LAFLLLIHGINIDIFIYLVKKAGRATSIVGTAYQLLSAIIEACSAHLSTVNIILEYFLCFSRQPFTGTGYLEPSANGTYSREFCALSMFSSVLATFACQIFVKYYIY